MKIINNISPLPFYESIDMQHHRRDYSFGQIYPLMVPANLIIPFQFIIQPSVTSAFNNDYNNDFDKEGADTRATQSTTLQHVKLWSLNSGTFVNITASMTSNRLSVSNISADLLLVKYPGTLPVSELTQEGPYYLEIKLQDIDPIYSDVFVSAKDTTRCILLDYGNSYNLELPQGYIDFSDDFRFRCYLDAAIGRPEYVFEEEVTERMGYSFMESQVSKKRYKFVCIAPEYLCDALRIIRLCNSKRIFDKYSSYELFSFSMEPKWEDQGDLASVECEFETDTVIQNIGNLK